MAASLEPLLRMLNSGNTTLSPEMYQYFGGDDILKAVQQYDPNAKWVDDGGGGGDGQIGGGKRLEFNQTLLPKTQVGDVGLDVRNSNFGQLKNPNAVMHDDNYGDITNSANVAKPKDPLWTILAPIAIATLAPMAGAALAGAGIGGTAGLTAGVTGSGLSGSAPGWLANLVKGGPNTIGNLARGNLLGAAMSVAPSLGAGAGINPMITRGGMTLADLAWRKR